MHAVLNLPNFGTILRVRSRQNRSTPRSPEERKKAATMPTTAVEGLIVVLGILFSNDESHVERFVQPMLSIVVGNAWLNTCFNI